MEPQKTAQKSAQGSAHDDAGPAPMPGRSSLAQASGDSGALFSGAPQWETINVIGDALGGSARSSVDPEDDPATVPAEFKQLDPQLIELFVRSRPTLAGLAGKKLWPAIRELPVTHLHTVVQIQKRTMAAGLWPAITQLKEIYTYATSFGVFFLSTGDPGGVTTNGKWGKDAPQDRVQKEHPNGERYTWYRQDTGGGNPGLHLGVGGGDHDVHVDPNNPMRKVSEGEYALIPPSWKARGEAIYHPWYLLEHAAEIKLGVDTENAKQNRSYIGAWALDESRKHAINYINFERSAQPRTKNLARSQQIIGWIEPVLARIEAYNAQARRLAQLDDPAAAAELEGVDVNVKHTRKELITLLLSFAQHMHEENPDVPMDGWDTRAKWEENTFGYYDVCAKLTATRKKP